MSSALPRAWVFTNHSPERIFSGYGSILPEDLIVAADAGLNAIHSLGLKPDVLIGDLDSLDAGIVECYQSMPRITHDTRKNETDTELAVEWCLRQGIADITICNDLEGRFDHALGIIQVMYAAHLEAARCRVESAAQRLFFLPPIWRAQDLKGCLLSLLAWTHTAHLESSQGLEYPLDGLVLRQNRSRGISNEIISDQASIRLAEGQVLAVLTKL